MVCVSPLSHTHHPVVLDQGAQHFFAESRSPLPRLRRSAGAGCPRAPWGGVQLLNPSVALGAASLSSGGEGQGRPDLSGGFACADISWGGVSTKPSRRWAKKGVTPLLFRVLQTQAGSLRLRIRSTSLCLCVQKGNNYILE